MEPVFTARTCYGTVLSIDVADRRLRHAHAGELGQHLLPAQLLTGGSLGIRCLPFAFHPVTNRPILPVPIAAGSGILLEAMQGSQPHRLRSAVTSRYLSSVPDGRIEADRPAASSWEEFVLSPMPVDAAPGPQAVEHFIAVARTALAASTPWAQSIAALLAGPASDTVAALVEAVWPLLTLEEFDRLVGRMRQNRALAMRLTELFPTDFYAVTAVPALLQSLAERDATQRPVASGARIPGQPAPPSAWPWRDTAGAAAVPTPAVAPPRLIGPALDHLARDGYDGRLSSFAHACNAALREQAAPTKGTAIVATARSEGVYLLEWIAHHRLVGIETIFLYTNDNDDGSDALLAALHQAGIITWTRSELAAGCSAQNKAYGHALNVNIRLLDHRWALFIDLDEFLVLNPERYRTAADFARWHEMRQTDAVGINWVMVGSSGQSSWTDAPLTMRNTNLLNEPNAHLKVMMAPRHFIQAHPHFPFADHRRGVLFRLASGAMHEYRKQPIGNYHARAFSDEPSSADACLYHYNFKSVEEFAWKVSRNRGDFPLSHGVNFEALDHVAVGSFLNQHRSQNVTASAQVAGGLPALQAEIDRLRALPGVAEAERALTALFRQRLTLVKTKLMAEPRLAQLGGPGEEMRALLQATLG